MNPDDHFSTATGGTDRPCIKALPGLPEGGDCGLLHFMTHIQSFRRHQDLWATVSRLVRRLLNASGGGIMLLDRQAGEFFIPAASVEDAEMEARFKGMRFPAGRFPLEQLFSNRTASIFHSASDRPVLFQNMDAQISEYTLNRLDVPLRTMDGMIGTLWAVNRKAGQFDAPAIALTNALAGIIGSAMENIAGKPQAFLSDRSKRHFERVEHHIVDDLSHAIKTPLAVSIASLKLLERYLKKLPDSGWQRIFRRTERNLGRLLTIEYEMEDILRRQTPGDPSVAFSPRHTVAAAPNEPIVGRPLASSPKGITKPKDTVG